MDTNSHVLTTHQHRITLSDNQLGKALLDVEASENLVIQFDKCRERIKCVFKDSKAFFGNTL